MFATCELIVPLDLGYVRLQAPVRRTFEVPAQFRFVATSFFAGTFNAFDLGFVSPATRTRKTRAINHFVATGVNSDDGVVTEHGFQSPSLRAFQIVTLLDGVTARCHAVSLD